MKLLSSDGMIGAVGCCLACGALAFGVYMNVHGPADGLGKSGDFTVFAQLAPRGLRQARPPRTDGEVDLDTTATATVSRTVQAGATIIPSISLAAADEDAATLMIAGRPRVVRLGDDVPGAGEVLAIVPGASPVVRTTRGLIVPASGR